MASGREGGGRGLWERIGSFLSRCLSREFLTTLKAPAPANAPVGPIDLGGGVTMDIVLVPPGSFQMGSATGGSEEKPIHTVTFAKALFMGKYAVTQEQWETVMGSNPSSFKGADLPAESVSWHACQEFVRKLSRRTGRKFWLPSEAEWEYACRAGSATEYCFGDDDRQLGEYAWCSANSGDTTHPVGQKKPNAWGLFDMHGNVWEWCEDVWHASYEGAPADGSAWLAGGDGSVRVLRGGSWNFYPRLCRSATRHRYNPWNVWNDLGFRVCLRDF